MHSNNYNNNTRPRPRNPRPRPSRRLAPASHREEPHIAPLLPPSKEMPVAKHLSTSSTPLTNDPLWLNSFCIEGHEGLVQPARPQEFQPSTDFLSLIIADYQQINSANKPFDKSVALSTYVYYNVMHLWARLLAIERHYGRVHDIDRQFLAHFEMFDQ